MSAVAFDTLKAARHLIAAGMPIKQAEAQAEVMAEAFVFNMGSLVTRDYLDARLDARFAEQDARIDARFIEQDARIDARFAEQDVRFEKRFTQIDNRISVQGNRIDVLTSDMNGKFRLVYWMLTALIGGNAALLSMVYKLAN